MPDDRFYDDNVRPEDKDNDPTNPEIPASVAFMEMMRQAAAKAEASRPQPPSAAEQLFKRPVQTPNPQAQHTAQKTVTTTSTVPVVETPKTKSTQELQAAIEEQRVRRVKRRKAKRRRQTVGVIGGIIRTLIVGVIAAGLMATIFAWWTPSQFINESVKQELSVAQATSQSTLIPTSIPTPNWLRKVGIVSGHRGPQVPPDPGAVCPDGLTEAEINFAVAQLVVRNLRGRGYSVDLLDEFDSRLANYQAAALVSIHANTCQDFGELVSGFLIANAAARTGRGTDDLLVDCVAQYYGQHTGLQRREGVTVDMTDYHTFREIHPLTPAAIIELGFLLGDRAVLTGNQEQMAQGITDGVLCFLEPSQPPTVETPLATGTGG